MANEMAHSESSDHVRRLGRTRKVSRAKAKIIEPMVPAAIKENPIQLIYKNWIVD